MRALLSLSGGMDSASLLAYLLASESYKSIQAYGFYYGQKHQRELECAKKVVDMMQKKGYDVTYQVIDLESAFSDSQSSLKSGGPDVPHGHYAAENMKSTVVENRNIIFSSILYGKALAMSKKFDDDVEIALGIHAGDHSIYPDCRPESRAMAQELFRISNWGSERVEYISPFVMNSKGEVLQHGIDGLRKLGFSEAEIDEFYANTHTCYDPNEAGESCGLCGSCNERLEAFEFVGRADPVKYQGAK